MRVLSVEDLLEWIAGTVSPGEPPDKTHTRFKAAFGLGTPREVFDEMQKNFYKAMAIHARRQPKE